MDVDPQLIDDAVRAFRERLLVSIEEMSEARSAAAADQEVCRQATANSLTSV